MFAFFLALIKAAPDNYDQPRWVALMLRRIAVVLGLLLAVMAFLVISLGTTLAVGGFMLDFFLKMTLIGVLYASGVLLLTGLIYCLISGLLALFDIAERGALGSTRPPQSSRPSSP